MKTSCWFRFSGYRWLFTFALLVACGLRHSAAAAESIRVEVVDERASAITKFHYDNVGLQNWSDEIFVRNASSSDSVFCSCPQFTIENTICEPYAYRNQVPGIAIEVFGEVGVVFTGGYNGVTDIAVPGPGLYTVRVSTTFQFDEIRHEFLEEYPTLFNLRGEVFIPPSPFRVDERGQFEVFRTELVNISGVYAYVYHKRYTYNVLCSVRTHVRAGESDFALVVVPHHPEVWGCAARMATNVCYEIGEDIAIETAIAAVDDRLKSILREQGFGRWRSSLLASYLANFVYFTLSPEEDFDLEAFATTSLSSIVTEMIVMRLGLAAGTGSVGIAVGVSIAVNKLNDYIRWTILKNALTASASDDIAVLKKVDSFRTWAHVTNRGGPLLNVKLGALRNGQLVEYSERGVAEKLRTGATEVFEYRPERPDCFECESVVVFTMPVLSARCSVQLYVRFSDLEQLTETVSKPTNPPPKTPEGFRIVNGN